MYAVSRTMMYLVSGILVSLVLIYITLSWQSFYSFVMFPKYVAIHSDNAGYVDTVSYTNVVADGYRAASAGAANIDNVLNADVDSDYDGDCIGNLPRMAEDLLCEKRPAYLPNFKNPCWYEEDGRLQCLPYFMILGVPKAGTNDLFHRIVAHPDVVTHAYVKEISYWSRLRYNHPGKQQPPTSFKRFKALYANASKRIEEEVNNTYHRLIVGDGSVTDFADFRGWKQIPQNIGYEEPNVLTPHLMKHLYRKPKFILLLRNPAERLYSQFYFLKKGDSPEDFHKAVLQSLRLEEECLKINTPKLCLFREEIDQLPVRLYVGCYSAFLREWLRVFPREYFLFVRSEDYQKDIKGTVRQVYDFLDLPYTEEMLTRVSEQPKRHETVSKHKAGPMLTETRTLLYNFYRNYSRDLAHILGDSRYLWEDNDE